jgi:hypothetical protein
MNMEQNERWHTPYIRRERLNAPLSVPSGPQIWSVQGKHMQKSAERCSVLATENGDGFLFF